MVVMGTPYCYQHLLSECHLRIAKSRIPQAGLGLFASTTSKVKQPVKTKEHLLFKKGAKIVEYLGEVIDEDEQARRYGRVKTAPYALEGKDGDILDSACQRSAASFANSLAMSKSNARFSKGRDGRMWILALKNVYDGDEINANYGKEYKLDDGSRHVTK